MGTIFGLAYLCMKSSKQTSTHTYIVAVIFLQLVGVALVIVMAIRIGTAVIMAMRVASIICNRTVVVVTL